MHQRRVNSGFTLVELMLAMAFVSVLLLSVAMVAVQAGKIYNRGTVMKTVNQSGRTISDVIRRDFLQSSATKIVNSANPVIVVRESGLVRSGRVCLGQYSYVWNMASAIDDPVVRRSGKGVVRSNGQAINLARVLDEDAALCQSTSDSYPMDIEPERVTHLLRPIDGTDVAIAVHDFTASRVTSANNSEALYKVSFTLGTSAVAELQDMACKPPEDNEANFNFCAINNFEMIVRTNG